MNINFRLPAVAQNLSSRLPGPFFNSVFYPFFAFLKSSKDHEKYIKD